MVFVHFDGPRRITKARELRRTQTKAEKILWDHVRNRQLGGHKIRRQQILNEIIIDFYCTDKRLCIEIDGPYHNEPIRKELDKQRDENLEEHGYVVMRFYNDQVIFELQQVLCEILKTLQSIQSHPQNPLNQRPSGDFTLIPLNSKESLLTTQDAFVVSE